MSRFLCSTLVMACLGCASSTTGDTHPDPGTGQPAACADVSNGPLFPTAVDCESTLWCRFPVPFSIQRLHQLPDGNLVGVGFLAGAGQVQRWDGCQWTSLHPGQVLGEILASHVDVFGQVWLADDGAAGLRLLHLGPTPGSITTVALDSLGFGGAVSALWTGPDGEVWAATESGGVAHQEAGVWRQLAYQVPVPILAMAGVDRNHLWMAGAQGTLLEHSENHLGQTSITLAETLLDVAAVSLDDVWAVGTKGTVLHWDGTSWWGMDGAGMQDVTAVAATSSSNVWMVGGRQVMRWTGREVAPQQVASLERASDVLVDGAGNVWVASGVGELRILRARDQ